MTGGGSGENRIASGPEVKKKRGADESLRASKWSGFAPPAPPAQARRNEKGRAIAARPLPPAEWPQFSALSVIALVQAPSGILVITGSEPPPIRVATVRS